MTAKSPEVRLPEIPNVGWEKGHINPGGTEFNKTECRTAFYTLQTLREKVCQDFTTNHHKYSESSKIFFEARINILSAAMHVLTELINEGDAI